jgi:hypothetical protein
MARRAITSAIGSAGFPPEPTSVIAACGPGVGVDELSPGDWAISGVAAAVGVASIPGVTCAGGGALRLRLGVALADLMAGGCVGRAVGRGVGFGVADGDGGDVAAVVTTMLPCIATYPWMLQ